MHIKRVLWIDHGFGLFEKMEMFACTKKVKLIEECSTLMGVHLAHTKSFDAILVAGKTYCAFHPYGANVINAIREKGVTTRIIVFSSMAAFREAGMRAGADGEFDKDCLYRPGWEDELYKTLFP